MLKDYYQQELANLRELGVEFSRDNPALAPMLAAKGDDPDVERLLEGVAFLSSLIRRKLSEGFPDFIESLLKVVFPQVLLPTPSATMMHFRPVEGFNETIKLAKGSLVASIPIEGAQAKFATTTDLTIVPAAVTKVLVKDESNGEKSLSLLISSSAPLSTWLTDSLSIHLAGDYPEASERRKILLDNVLGLTASVRSQSLSLPPDLIGPAGFASTIRSFNREPLTAFELTQDYFIMPQKLLFLKVSGLKPLCQSTQNALTLTFRLSGLKGPLPAMRPEHFLLNICPAVNIFPYPAHPLTVDHRHNEYLLRPQDFESEKLDIYLVSKVASLLPSGETLKYVPFESFAEGSENERLYSVARRPSPITGLPEHYLSVIYPKNSPVPTKETLSISLMCHNLGLTDYLHSGEIKEPTDTSPAMATFANIIPPTKHSPPVATDAQLWNLLSHLHVNLMPNLSADALKEILTLHALPNDTDIARKLSNSRRISAIESTSSKMETTFIRGLPISGSKIELTVDSGGFASRGDLRLFGDVIEQLFGMYHHINAYCKLTIIEKNTREVMSWPPRLGLKRLL